MTPVCDTQMLIPEKAISSSHDVSDMTHTVTMSNSLSSMVHRTFTRQWPIAHMHVVVTYVTLTTLNIFDYWVLYRFSVQKHCGCSKGCDKETLEETETVAAGIQKFSPVNLKHYFRTYFHIIEAYLSDSRLIWSRRVWKAPCMLYNRCLFCVWMTIHDGRALTFC